MSFRLFVYWCALCGGWAGALGWGLGHIVAHDDLAAGTGIKGLFLGMQVALAIALVDALWVYSLRQITRVLPRVLACLALGSVSGLIGGFAGQALFDWENWPSFVIFGWVLTGLMIGVAIGSYDFLRGWVREEELGWAGRKMMRGLFGGAIGGLLGGLVEWKLGDLWTTLLPATPDPWAPSLAGFIALGACIGLMIALARLVLTESWLKVEAGFRAGRELLLDQPVLTIGRAESCDLGLFGDSAIDKLHARIFLQDGHHLIADNGSTNGTFVNDQRVTEPTLLRSGDLIRVGNAYLRFSERKKK